MWYLHHRGAGLPLSIDEKGHQGVTREATNEACTRFTIKMSRDESARLSADDELIYDPDSLQAVEEATVAVFKRFGGAEKFTEVTAIPGRKPGLACLLGHLAVVCTKIDEELMRLGGSTGTTAPGVNNRHREAEREMLRVLDGALTQRAETRNGLRLIDGDRADDGQTPDDVVHGERVEDLVPDETSSGSVRAGGSATT